MGQSQKTLHPAEFVLASHNLEHWKCSQNNTWFFKRKTCNNAHNYNKNSFLPYLYWHRNEGNTWIFKHLYAGVYGNLIDKKPVVLIR